MISPIFKLATGAVRGSLKEAIDAEDEDITIIVDSGESEVPLSDDEQEIVDWINSQKTTRKIEYLFLHTTATHTDAKVSSIVKYWKDRLGWVNSGYNGIITRDGKVSILADLNQVCNGVKGYNSKSIHFSFIGGIDKNGKAIDNRTAEQKSMFEVIIKTIKNKYTDIIILGHNQKSTKRCPCFDVPLYLKEIGVD
jgi:N-acetylmuramoyl-L-alanine amidase